MSHQVPIRLDSDQRDRRQVPDAEVSLANFREMAELLCDAGVDLLLMEMMSDPDLANPALDASTGALIDIVGPLGIGGPEGLAFVTVNADPLDCSGDGMVDVADLACSNAADTTPELLLQLNLLEGDFDGQNGVDFNDFLNLASNYGQPLGRYIDGDIDDNGIVEFADFLRLAANYGQTSSASVAAVPEPAGWTMVAFATLAGFVLFRRRS